MNDNENSNLYMVAQKWKQVDVIYRELAHVVVLCQQIQKGKQLFIVTKFFDGIDGFLYGSPISTKWFKASPYFQYYDTKEYVRFLDYEKSYL